MEMATDTTVSRWLARLVGHWILEGEAFGDGGGTPWRFSGTEHVRALDGGWLLADGMTTSPDGGPETSLAVLGFDPRAGRVVGSRFDSRRTHQWVLTGELDEEAGVLSLETAGPLPAGGGEPPRYRQTIELRGDDRRRLASRRLGADGKWRDHRVVHYRRTGW